VKKFLQLAEACRARRDTAASAMAHEHLQHMARSYAALAEAQDQLERSFRAEAELKRLYRELMGRGPG